MGFLDMFRAKRNNPYAQVEGQREAMKGANARAGAQQATTPAPNGTGTAVSGPRAVITPGQQQLQAEHEKNLQREAEARAHEQRPVIPTQTNLQAEHEENKEAEESQEHYERALGILRSHPNITDDEAAHEYMKQYYNLGDKDFDYSDKSVVALRDYYKGHIRAARAALQNNQGIGQPGENLVLAPKPNEIKQDWGQIAPTASGWREGQQQPVEQQQPTIEEQMHNAASNLKQRVEQQATLPAQNLSNADWVNKELMNYLEAPLTPEEQAKRERATSAVAGIANLGNLLSAFSNLVFTTKGAPSQPSAKPIDNGTALSKERDYWDKVRQRYLSGQLATNRLDIEKKRQSALADYYLAQADKWKAKQELDEFVAQSNADKARWRREYEQGILDIRKEQNEIRRKEASIKERLAAHKISHDQAKQMLDELKEQDKMLGNIVTTTKEKVDPITGEKVKETTTRETVPRGGEKKKTVAGFSGQNNKKKIQGFN